MRILLVEDDNMIGQSLRQALTDHGLAKFGADVIRNVRGLGWCVSKADA